MWEALRGAGPVSEATFSFLRNAAKAAGVAAGQSAYDRCGAAEAPWRPFGLGAVCGSVKELLPLKAHVVDGIGHYQGTPHAYDSFTRALVEFCMLAPGYSGPRRSRL